MPEVNVPSEAGRLETRFFFNKNPEAPVALFLHPHAFLGGGMNHPVMYQLFYTFGERGFNVVRFNFRGVGNSTGSASEGEGELMDACTILDWVQELRPKAKEFWLIGHSFGSWIAMQLTARRPEVSHFVAVSPPASIYDFSFLDESFCTAKGLIAAGEMDNITPRGYMGALKDLVGNTELETIPGADHFFNDTEADLVKVVEKFMATQGR